MLQYFTVVLHFLRLVLAVLSTGQSNISCRNEKNEPVDWFIIYKLPKYVMGNAGTGLDYMYLDGSMKNWELSTFKVNSTNGAAGHTLGQLYQGKGYKSNSSAYLLYNDAPPELPYDMEHGHTKGVVMFDKSQGFWLSHTIPHFPPFPERGFDYPSTGMFYGQVLFCVTYSYDQFHAISEQLAYSNPHVYNCSLPAPLWADMTRLAQLCLRVNPRLPRDRSVKKLVSAKGESFLSFVKSHLFVDDIYASWVAQLLDTDLLVESWQREGTKLFSNCSLRRHVLNVSGVRLPGPFYFHSHIDHSKWCVSVKPRDRWVCLGDLNRERGQAYRDGGLICTQNALIYRVFRQAIYSFFKC
ncbi:LOW QUALITY PROTEIN: deoxyribonuclease-2-beta-like [Alosa alosa]|uniref:LOW QUALITY PROTEIN: deoxyribonuclease-2-beta-like n=1 Tax=Alosa alosa TaxID=278164 RepID=UPI0020154640|nr:LOW QUALITY PROTEIN: deoxyribonuclease-2-beta-like [Alosa alosa]